MKYVYTIISQQFMPQFEVRLQDVGTVEFAFTSKQKAIAQMMKIEELIESGEWYMESPNEPVEHKIEYYNAYALTNAYRQTMIDMKVTHSNGTYTIYSLKRCVLNAGYGI